VLPLHGFTDTPSSLRLVGHELNTRVYGVVAPLPASHGMSLDELIPVRRVEWTAQVEGWIHHLAEQGRLVVGGLSLGALLAL